MPATPSAQDTSAASVSSLALCPRCLGAGWIGTTLLLAACTPLSPLDGSGGAAGGGAGGAAGGGAGGAAGGTTELVWPNAESAANSDPWIAEHHQEIRQMRPRVLALNFVNARTNEQMLVQLNEMVEVVKESSRYHGDRQPDSPPFLQYEIAYAIDLRDPSPPANWPYNNSTLYPREDPVQGQWGFDYEQLFTPAFADRYGIDDPDDPARHLTLCELVDRGLVHEVWIYGDADVPDVSAAEILERKPDYDENRQRLDLPMSRCAGNGCFDAEDAFPPECTRTVRIGWFNNTRGPGCYLESLSHGFESIGAWNAQIVPTLSRAFIPFAGYRLNERYGVPFDSWYDCTYGDPCLSYPTETSVDYQLAAQSGTIDPYDAVCGNVHFAPNARSHYDLVSPFTVQSTCRSYRSAAGTVAEPFDEATYADYTSLAPDCQGPFLVWWRQQFPGLDNDALDEAGDPMLNWWPFIYY